MPVSEVVRHRVARQLQHRLMAGCRAVTNEQLEGKALVIAPHFDDETLGCGGTLALKSRLGAEIDIVFLSDGAASHGSGIDGRRLSAIRRSEAEDALEALELRLGHVTFGDLPDGGLAGVLDDAVGLISSALVQGRPMQVYAPHKGDDHADHTAATTATEAAIEAVDAKVELYEYPVWQWQQWPWVGLSSPRKRRSWGPSELHGHAWRRSARNAFGMRFPASLNRVVDISTTLGHKRTALAHYHSQTGGLEGMAGPSLADVSFGHLLERLTGDREYFRVSGGG
jgi:LmbE family N-acetylglucosaminyl deacetylase